MQNEKKGIGQINDGINASGIHQFPVDYTIGNSFHICYMLVNKTLLVYRRVQIGHSDENSNICFFISF